MNLQAVIFDLDDTLYLEESYVLSGFRAVAQFAAGSLDIPEDQGFDELESLHHNGTRGKTFDEWAQLRGFDAKKWTPKLVAAYREHKPTIQCAPEVPGVLEELSKKFPLGLITDGWLNVQKAKIAALAIEHYFQVLVVSDQWGREFWKPHERPYLAALDSLSVPPNQAVYVADNPQKDFFGAHRVGMKSIRLRRSRGIYAQLEPESAEYAAMGEICSLEELIPLILGES